VRGRRTAYREEAARVWLGRHHAGGAYRPFHVFVMGHTHLPQLLYIV
jgi:hypothetical protein